MRTRLRPAGLLIVTMRDFDDALLERAPLAPPIIVAGSPRRVLIRIHDWDADRPCYTVRYLVLTERGDGWTITEHATRYRAITRDELTRAAHVAGFSDISFPNERTVVGGQQVMTATSA